MVRLHAVSGAVASVLRSWPYLHSFSSPCSSVPSQPSFLSSFVGWLQQGRMAADEQAALRAMLLLRLEQPRLAATAAALAVRMRAKDLATAAAAAAGEQGNTSHAQAAGSHSHQARCLPQSMQLSDQGLDQLAQAFFLHGRALLLSTTSFATASQGCSLAQQPHAAVLDSKEYRAALCSLFCAAQLSPRNAAYTSATATSDVQVNSSSSARWKVGPAHAREHGVL